jgi:hypothetical protein
MDIFVPILLLKMVASIVLFPVVFLTTWVFSVNNNFNRWPSYERWEHIAVAMVVALPIASIPWWLW